MKKLIVLLITMPFLLNFTSNVTNGEEIFTLSQTDIVVKSKFIDAFYHGEFPENCTVKNTSTISSKNNAYQWSLNFLRYTEWGSIEPGDYEFLEIKNNGNLICKIKNDMSWAKVETRLRNYTNNDYFIPIQLSETATAIILTGNQYPTEPALLTIIVIEKGIAKLVYNKEMLINSITKTATSFSMVTQSNIQEWDEDNNPITAPITHRIWAENGVLKFENL